MDSFPHADDLHDQQRQDSSGPARDKLRALHPPKNDERATELAPQQAQPAPEETGTRNSVEICAISPDIGRDELASNDQALSSATGRAHPPVVDLLFLAAAWGDASLPPADCPHLDRAELGQLTAVKRVVDLGIVPQAFVDDILRARAKVPQGQAPGATVVPMMRRVGTHPLYVLGIEIGTRLELSKPLDGDLLGIYGAWLVRRMLEPQWMPPATTIARLRAALIRPDGRTAHGWQSAGRQRALTNASHALQQAIEAKPQAAVAMGLREQIDRKALACDDLSVFGRAFRRRVHNLRDFAAKNQIAGAAGYGCLSLHGLRESGQRLRDRVHVGEEIATHICLQVLSHLPSHTLQLLPVIRGGAAPEEAQAWLNLDTGTYHYRLFHLIERGARPAPGAERCYEVTSQIVSINLSPFLAEDLLTRARRVSGNLATEQDLLGKIDLHPQADVGAGKGYKVTVRRLQESVPTHLLKLGLHRWPVAMATNSQFLLSRGRPAYSVCRATAIMETVNQSYELLGWPNAQVTSGDQTLIGSFVTPRADSVAGMLNDLADRADRRRAVNSSRGELIDELNAHACWTAAVMAFCLALRQWALYEVVQAELTAGVEVHFDDKNVHARKGPPVPVATFLQRTIVAWLTYCTDMASRLESLGDTVSVALALRIRERVSQANSGECVFTIDGLGQLVSVGSRTWHSVLPPSQALQENFGRHFWPFHLMEQGVTQLEIDRLMRHQIDGLHPAGSSTAYSRQAAVRRLRQAIDTVIASLELQMPSKFGHE